MKRIFIRINDFMLRFYRVILFLITVVILVYLFPREGKFRFEFQKSKPWMHESLIAPFDFPIYKQDAEIETEKDSILRNYKPYFIYDSKIGTDQQNRFADYLKSRIDAYVSENESHKSVAGIKSKIVDTLVRKLMFVYQKGVVELPEPVVSRTVISVQNNIAEETEVSDLFSPKSAYRYVSRDLSSLKEYAGTGGEEFYASVLKRLNIENFIVPNMSYDPLASDNAKQELLKKISLTKGMVQKGERIILTGDIVNEETNRILLSLKKEYETRIGKIGNYRLMVLGQFIIVFVIILLLFLYIHNFRKEIMSHKVKTTFIILLILIMATITGIVIKYNVANIYIIPLALVPIMVNSFYDSRLALITHLVLTLIIGFWAPNSFEFVMLNFAVGIVAILRLSNQFNRNRIFFTSLAVMLTYTVLFYGKFIMQEADWKTVDPKYLSIFVFNGMLLLTSIPLIYFFERSFGFLSNTTLLELSDTNQHLLRKLAQEAPGTFQHSMQVANLAEEAIRAIGGNTLLVRTGALYHDIGKLKNPQYFIENQHSEANPHTDMALEDSAKIIIGHIEDGVAMAKKQGIPQAIIDFIQTHHGDSTVTYFYSLFLKKHPEKEVNLSYFSYPGPKPQSKEAAVVMLSDSVEAASRSLKTYNEGSISLLVDSIINRYLDNGQLNEADITLRNITQIKSIFKRRLLNIYHVRIAYPVMDEEEDDV